MPRDIPEQWTQKHRGRDLKSCKQKTFYSPREWLV